MSTPSQMPPGRPPLPAYSRALIGTIWSITAIATLSVIARLAIRYRRFTKLYWDDFSLLVAWAFALPLAIQPTLANTDTSNASKNRSIFHGRIITQLFFYTSLWAVKISFLIFFRRLGARHIGPLKTYWRCVLGFTILTYCCLWTTNPYGCWIKKGIWTCEGDPSTLHLKRITFNIVCALDIITDISIMVIPFIVLRHARLTTRQRLVLYPLFSLVIITMAVAIIRAVISTRMMSGKDSIMWTVFLCHLESHTAIIVACIGSFRALFTSENSSRGSSNKKTWIGPPIGVPQPPPVDPENMLHGTDLTVMAPKSVPQAVIKDKSVPQEQYTKDQPVIASSPLDSTKF